MEAALRARETGLKPIIYEKGELLGGDLAMVKDPFKKSEFTRLLDYYLHEIKRFGIDVVLSTESRSPHILAIPPVIYPDLPDSGDISVDSNIYKHHDQMLMIAEHNRVEASERSLNSLDRNRQIAFRKMAEKKGVVFVSDLDRDFDVRNFTANQYDLKSAMELGISRVESYIRFNLPDLS